MKIARAATAAAFGLLLAGCPRNQQAEVAPDTAVVAPPHDPGAMPEAVQSVDLAPLAGEAATAQAVILPIGVQSQITLYVRHAPPNISLTAHVMTGSCEQPGPTAADLQPIVIDGGGRGTSQIVIDLAPQVLTNGNHALQLRRSNGRDGVPVACGEIPAHPAQHSGR